MLNNDVYGLWLLVDSGAFTGGIWVWVWAQSQRNKVHWVLRALALSEFEYSYIQHVSASGINVQFYLCTEKVRRRSVVGKVRRC